MEMELVRRKVATYLEPEETLRLLSCALNVIRCRGAITVQAYSPLTQASLRSVLPCGDATTPAV